MATAAETFIVVRPFLVGGKRREIGSKLQVGGSLAIELLAANKIERAPEKPAKAGKDGDEKSAVGE